MLGKVALEGTTGGYTASISDGLAHDAIALEAWRFYDEARKNPGRFEKFGPALRRIDEAGVGSCLHCGDEISPKRLDAVPWTPFCLRCPEAADLGDECVLNQPGHGSYTRREFPINALTTNIGPLSVTPL